MKNVLMIDIETLGTAAGSVVLAIGAAGKDKNGELVEYYKGIEIQTQLDGGRKIDFDTLKWWMSQNAKAKKVFDDATGDTEETLKRFIAWISLHFDLNDLIVVGNGANFDITIIEDLMATYGIKAPWKFWNIRCYRTIKNLCPKVMMKRIGTHHNALDDSLSQLDHLERIIETIDQGLKAIGK